MNNLEKIVDSLVADEMKRASESGFLVAVTQRDHDHVEVDIQRSDKRPWLRFYVDPRASEAAMREQIRDGLSKDGDVRS